jgi:hypothetical protein
VKIRILKALGGVMDSHSLSQYIPGFVYEVPEPLGTQLVQMGAAVELRSTDSSFTADDLSRVSGGVKVVPPDTAEDRPDRRRRKKR